MSTTRASYLRLVLICAAWALGATVVAQMGARALDPVVPLLFAAAAFVITQDLGRYRPRRRPGEAKYWRGRRIDDDEPPKRWN